MNRAERRRHRGHQHANLPVLPGAIPANTAEWHDIAMQQAHEDLPYVPGTQVRVLVYKPEDGYQALLDRGWRPDQIDQLRRHVEHMAAIHDESDPHVTIAMRVPRGTP